MLGLYYIRIESVVRMQSMSWLFTANIPYLNTRQDGNSVCGGGSSQSGEYKQPQIAIKIRI